MDLKTEALKKAMALLRRPHSCSELRKKLFKKQYPKQIIDATIKECLRLGFLDDATYAETYLQELKHKGFGSFQIKNKLAGKGIARELIDKVLDEGNLQDEELERAEKMFKQKLRVLIREKDPQKKRQKLFRYMTGRGYDFSVTSNLISKHLEN